MVKHFTVHKTRSLPNALYVNPNTIPLYLRFENNVNDSSGNGNNGTVTGTTTFVAGKVGQAFSFDGATRINCGDITSLHNLSQMSVFCWVNTTSLAAIEAIVTKWQNQTQDTFAIQLATTGFLTIIIGNAVNDAGGNSGSSTNNALTTNTWYLVGFVYDGTQSTNATKLKIYVNGIATTMSYVGTIPSTLNAGTAAVTVGEFTGSITRFFSGLIDQLTIFNFPLSQDQINYIYNSGNGLVLV